MHSRSTTATFKLSSLFLVTTLAAIAAAVFAADFGMGVLVLIVAAPALARTIVVVSRRNVLGWSSSEREKLVVFGQSMGVVLEILLLVAGVVGTAYFGAAAGGAALSRFGERARNAGEVVGTLFGLVLPGWAFWGVWHRATAVKRAMAATALNNEGALCIERGETDRALARFSEAAKLNPKLAAPHINRAIVYHAKREWAAALAEMDRAIALEPDRALSYSDRGRILLESGDVDAALVSVNTAIALDARLAAAYNDRGLVYLMQGSLTTAADDFEAAIRRDPANAQFYCNRAHTLQRLGRSTEALHDFDRALDLEPGLSEAYSSRGLLRHEMGESDRGLADLDRAIQMDPGFAIAFNNRGFIKAARGDHSGAIADYETAIRLVPDHPNAHKNLAWLLATSADARYRDGAKALAHAQRTLELSGGKQPQWLGILAAAFAECGDFEAAMTWQTKAIEASSEPATNEMSKRLAGYARQEPYRA